MRYRLSLGVAGGGTGLTRIKRTPSLGLAIGFGAAAVIGLAACSSASSSSTTGSSQSPAASPSPTPAERIATDSDIALDALISVGLTPACATADSGNGFLDLFKPYLGGLTNLGQNVQGSDFSVEALANCHPTLIVAPSYDKASKSNTYYNTAQKAEQGVARTVFFDQPNPPQDSAGNITSTWKNWLHAVADPVGRSRQANQVIANLDLRAAAIRAQIAGKTLVTVSLESASTFQTTNLYLPITTIYAQDLGLKNLTMPPSDWAKGCLSPTTPEPCYSNTLSLEKLPLLNSANAILVQSLVTSSNDVRVFNTNPLWRALPQVKSGHVAEAAFFTEIGPIGVGTEYSAIEHAFKLTEFSAALTGTTAGRASLTLDPATRRVCFALDPAAGTGNPGGPVTLSAGSAKLTLASSASYSAPDTSYQTSPPTSQATGCAVASPAVAKALSTAPTSVTLTYGGGAGTLTAGAASIVVH
jgi:ABC-type Fe3+-hydroxamate transport system substrate-binding protein